MARSMCNLYQNYVEIVQKSCSNDVHLNWHYVEVMVGHVYPIPEYVEQYVECVREF